MKKIIFFLSFLLIISTGVGYATFIFENAESTKEISGNAYADDIRDNYIYGEPGDPPVEEGQRYNVYFFAQTAFDPGNIVNGEPENTYYTDSWNRSWNSNYGSFQNSNIPGEGVSYKVLSDVTEIKVSDINNIGIPSVSITDRNNWPFVFNGWGLSFDENTYRRSGASINGSFPWGENRLDLIYFNTSLETLFRNANESEGTEAGIYADYVKIADDKSLNIYLFPIYTTGKDYYSHDTERQGNDAFRILNWNRDANNNPNIITENYFNENSDLQSEMTGSLSGMTAYTYNAYEFNDETEMISFQFAAYNWSANWSTLTFTNSRSSTDVSSTNYYYDFFRDGVINEGIYNIYVFKESWEWNGSGFTDSDIQNIDNLLLERDIQRYCSFYSSGYYGLFGGVRDNIFYNGSRVNLRYSFYIVFERLYEPRLLGGPTQGLTYDAGMDYQFNRDVDNHNLYYLKNVRLNNEEESNWFDYSEEYQISNIVFGVQLEQNENTIDLNIPDINTNPPTGYEDYSSKFFTDFNASDPEAVRRKDGGTVNSNDLSSLTNFLQIRKSDVDDISIGYGIYTILIEVVYDTMTSGDFGVYEPVYINVYAYRQHNIYIAIYDNGVTPPEDENNFISPTQNHGYSYYARELYLDTLLSVDTVFEISNPVTGNSTGETTLGAIIDDYTANGLELYDRVTGQVITRESLQAYPFRIMKNYVFHVKLI